MFHVDGLIWSKLHYMMANTKQITATVPTTTVSAVDKIAKSEFRSFSEMVAMLLAEAVKGRKSS